MKIEGVSYRSLWLAEDGWSVHVFDQTRLPWKQETLRLANATQVAHAIRSAQVRGAALVGVLGAYGMAMALRVDATDAALDAAAAQLTEARADLITLGDTTRRMAAALRPLPFTDRLRAAYAQAAAIAEADIATNTAIGRHGLALLAPIARQRGRVNVLTHGHAGWLGTMDWGTALAPIYMAHDAGMNVHVWVAESRPGFQGATLTAWELGRHGVPHTVIADGATGHMLQRGAVDIVLTGAEYVTLQGDVINTVGTYPVALAAQDNGVPFWVAVASSGIARSADTKVQGDDARAATELTIVTGRALDGSIATIRVVASGSAAANPGTDLTPARLISGLITEHGPCNATEAAIAALPAGGLRPLPQA